MVRAGRIALGAGSLLAKGVLGFVGLSIVIGWSTPPPQPVATASPQPGDPAQTSMAITLRVPEGAISKHVTILDETGRELAVVTHWITGLTTVVSRRDGGAGICCALNVDGTARLRVDGTSRATQIDAEQDGTSQVYRCARLFGRQGAEVFLSDGPMERMPERDRPPDVQNLQDPIARGFCTSPLLGQGHRRKL
jgi:hypothetical protein